MKLEQLIAAAREEAPRADPARRARLRLEVAQRVRTFDEALRTKADSRRAQNRKVRIGVLLAFATLLVVGTGFGMVEWHRRFTPPQVAGAPRNQVPDDGVPASPVTERPKESSSADTPSPPPAAPHHAIARGARTPSPKTPEIDVEVALLGEAREELGQGNGPGAVAVLDRYDGRFKIGALRQEAAALRVFALCDCSRQIEARASAAAFLKRWPQSPMRVRVQKACVDPAPP